ALYLAPARGPTLLHECAGARNTCVGAFRWLLEPLGALQRLKLSSEWRNCSTRGECELLVRWTIRAQRVPRPGSGFECVRDYADLRAGIHVPEIGSRSAIRACSSRRHLWKPGLSRNFPECVQIRFG